MVVFGGGPFGRWLSPEGRAFRNGISALEEESRELSFCLSTTWEYSKKEVTCNFKDGPHQTLMCWHFDFGLPASKQTNVCCLSHLVYHILLTKTALIANTRAHCTSRGRAGWLGTRPTHSYLISKSIHCSDALWSASHGAHISALPCLFSHIPLCQQTSVLPTFYSVFLSSWPTALSLASPHEWV